VRGKLAVLYVLVALAAVLVPTTAAASTQPARHPAARVHPKPAPKRLVRLWKIRYRAHDGRARSAVVALPSWYGPRHHPPIPLVISPHGRGVGARTNARLWGGLPALGDFAVVSPEGAGRKLGTYSWGSLGQIDDLARMPTIVRLTLPWLRVDMHRIYAVGGSMGGQETLLLLARHPKLLAGAAAFDSVTDLARQYRSFPRLRCAKACRKVWNGQLGKTLQALARREIGGSPWTRPLAYAVRSPLTYARSIAASCVPLELWWSVDDRIVLDQAMQSGALYRAIERLNPRAPVQSYVGYWTHSVEMQAKRRLPLAIAQLGLLRSQPWELTRGLHFTPAPAAGCGPPEPAVATSAPPTSSAPPAAPRRPSQAVAEIAAGAVAADEASAELLPGTR
jgi:pimeloyl-ACP methyl ester carboxylesterase